MKILIVEDEKIQSTSLKLHLFELGYTDVTVVNNVSPDHGKCQFGVYDLVFCDIRMPNVDGIALLSEYLSRDCITGVVIMSSVEDAILQLVNGMCHLLNYSFVETLAKPFEQDKLSDILERFSHLCRNQAVLNPRPSLTEQEVAQAFDNDKVFALYQPQYDFRSGKLVGVEALVRIDTPHYGVVTPDRFLNVVNRMGYTERLFVAVLEKSTFAVANLASDLKLSVNINQSLLQTKLCDLTLMICQINSFSPEKLTLEVTEEEAYNATPRALANLARLRLNGVQLSIDDFGTGYASLEQLVDLPFTELKIDKLFIDKATYDYKHQQLIKMILNLAQSLSLNCVAEGVEDNDTWEYLKELGIDVCQGYYTGRPMSIQEISNLVHFVTDSTVLPQLENARVLIGHQDSRTASQSKSPRKGVLLVDSNATRASALGKLLVKESNNKLAVHTCCINEVSALLRDLPLQHVVIDDSLALNDSEFLPLTELAADTERRPSFDLHLLASKESVATLGEYNLICKEGLVLDTARNVLRKIDEIACTESKSAAGLLSERELAVAKLLIAGFTNKYIAYELEISQKTVSTYKTRILAKLGLNTTLELSKFMSHHR
uniref:EAL domain-containing protein n=1 Tax=Thaumasiovibrio occultus TaxID=1891184 RepID=UPI000B359B29|nr:EAL domain-containing protein [Thaumasiovibrio occultus]